MSETNIIKWTPELLLEINLNSPDDFLKIKETLTRIGIESKKEVQTLYQSCHILHKKGKYYITHFKEMLELDGKLTNLSNEDIARRNTIGILLSDWGLLEIVNLNKTKPRTSLKNIKILAFSKKDNWNLRSKYSIGKT
jgi:alanine racemase